MFKNPFVEIIIYFSTHQKIPPDKNISDISIKISMLDKTALITLQRVHAVLLSEILPTMLIMSELKYVFLIRVDWNTSGETVA